MADISDRIRSLEALNQSLMLQNAQLSAKSAEQAQLISRYKAAHGDLFTCFERLPPELRQYIWKLSASSPRFIKVFDLSDHDTILNATANGKKWAAKCQTRAPSISAVCKESRDVFLREYFVIGPQHISAKNEDTEDENDRVILGPPIYLNPSIDTIYFDTPRLNTPDEIHSFKASLRALARCLKENPAKQNKSRCADMKKWGIRRMALGGDAIHIFQENLQNLALFSEFPVLEELVFLAPVNTFERGNKGPTFIGPPETDAEHGLWELYMQVVGSLKIMVDEKQDEGASKENDKEAEHKGFAKWAALKVTVSFEVGTESRLDYIVDAREGYDMYGPWDEGSPARLSRTAEFINNIITRIMSQLLPAIV